MIISASRRTDIPTYYSDWLVNRLRAGYVLVRNPMNPRQVSRVSLSPDVVDGIVFWTKNPIPMQSKLHAFEDYAYYFQFTLNAYGPDIEAGLPDKSRVIIPAFQRLSDQIGPDRVIWRYDPILLSSTYTIDEHVRRFEALAKRLHPYTRKCTISFIDLYAKTQRNLQVRALTAEEQHRLAKALSEIAHSFGLQMDTCAESIDLDRYGIGHARCIDGALFEKLLGCPLHASKDKNQRSECGCMESVDIGAYNTCLNGCAYCYANTSRSAAAKNAAAHHPDSPFLFGALLPGDRITDRKMVSNRMLQTTLNL